MKHKPGVRSSVRKCGMKLKRRERRYKRVYRKVREVNSVRLEEVTLPKRKIGSCTARIDNID